MWVASDSYGGINSTGWVRVPIISYFPSLSVVVFLCYLGQRRKGEALPIVYTQSNSHKDKTSRSKQLARAMKTMMWGGLVGSAGGSSQKSHIRLKAERVTKGSEGESKLKFGQRHLNDNALNKAGHSTQGSADESER